LTFDENVMTLSILLVEDEPQDLNDYLVEIPELVKTRGIEVVVVPCGNFDDGKRLAANPAHRFDLIVSDTYRGLPARRDAAVLELVTEYRKGRFCPLVVYSSSTQPPDLAVGPFLVWADKSRGMEDIARAIYQILDTGIPQLARMLHEELEQSGGSFLWEFLETKWGPLNYPERINPQVLERLIRRRAAVQLGDIDPQGDGVSRVSAIDGLEYYIYPSIVLKNFRLGEVLRHKANLADWRVILTPHCHLATQQGSNAPRASYVLTVKCCGAEEVIAAASGKAQPWKSNDQERREQLRRRTQSPAERVGEPAGRYWFLPSFLDIPYLYADFLQVESLAHDILSESYDRIACLASPFAEAIQACFSGFYGNVGLPPLRQESVAGMMPCSPVIAAAPPPAPRSR
jgi:hypothetical protein